MELIEYKLFTPDGIKGVHVPADYSPSVVLQAFQMSGALDVWNCTKKFREYLPLEYHHAKGASFRLVFFIEIHPHAGGFYREFPFSFSDMSLFMAAMQAKNSILSEFRSLNIAFSDCNITCKGIQIFYPDFEMTYPARHYACLSDLFENL